MNREIRHVLPPGVSHNSHEAHERRTCRPVGAAFHAAATSRGVYGSLSILTAAFAHPTDATGTRGLGRNSTTNKDANAHIPPVSVLWSYQKGNLNMPLPVTRNFRPSRVKKDPVNSKKGTASRIIPVLSVTLERFDIGSGTDIGRPSHGW